MCYIIRSRTPQGGRRMHMSYSAEMIVCFFFLLFHCGPMFPTAQRRQGGKMLGGPRPACYTGQLK